MKPGHRIPGGFSLIELIVLIVVVSIGAVMLLALFGGVARSLASNEDIQTAAQLAQECSEHVMAVRRNPAQGFAAVTDTVCDVLPAPLPGFTRAVAVTDLIVSPCTVTAAGTCRKVVVSIAKAGLKPAAVTLMVVNY